ncbi:MAG: four helix bundle protein [Blastocatellia bacterium]
MSIPSNIDEWQARRTTGDFVRFVSNADGSLAELETQLIISIDLEFFTNLDARTCLELMNEVRKMLNALRRSLLSKISNTD